MLSWLFYKIVFIKATASGLAVVMVLYGTLTIIGGILYMFLPETKGREIPDTIEEAENPKSLELKKVVN
jgi:hypothetical protein